MSNLTSQYIIAQEEHDYNKKYEEGTIVKHTIDDITTAYIAKRNVPQFVSILDKNYWKKIASTDEGGTVDYDNLKNKPTINGVKLDGNKTSQDLGVYSKPSNGIPQSDLSSDVQSQLNKHFKGWYDTLEELKAAHTAIDGDSAYVKDASPATTWSIYVYDSTASSDNYWADSGTDADTSNVQTFESGQEVNETPIDDTHLVNPKSGALPTANDALQLKAKLEGVTASETKVNAVVGTNVTTGAYVSGETGLLVTPGSSVSSYAYFELAIPQGTKSIRFATGTKASSAKIGYSIGHYEENVYVPTRKFYFDVAETTPPTGIVEKVIEVLEGETTFMATVTSVSTYASITLEKYYCYLQSGKSVNELIDDIVGKEEDYDEPLSKNGNWQVKIGNASTGMEEAAIAYSVSDNAIKRNISEYKGKQLTIVGNSTYNTYYMFLKKSINLPQSGSPYTLQYLVDNGYLSSYHNVDNTWKASFIVSTINPSIITIPDDAEYLCVSIKTIQDNNNRSPKSISVQLIRHIDGVIDEKIAEISDYFYGLSLRHNTIDTITHKEINSTKSLLTSPIHLKDGYCIRFADEFNISAVHYYDKDGNYIGMHKSRYFINEIYPPIIGDASFVPNISVKVEITKKDGSDITSTNGVIKRFTTLTDTRLSHETPRSAANYGEYKHRIRQITNIEWIALEKVKGGYVLDQYLYNKGMLTLGIPYSEACEYSKYVAGKIGNGFVSFKTFYTSLLNRHTVMYTEGIEANHSKSAYGITYHGYSEEGHSGPFYGNVCADLTRYAAGIVNPNKDGAINQNPWYRIARGYKPSGGDIVWTDGTNTLNIDEVISLIKPMDSVLNVGHYSTISDIYIDYDGNKFFVWSEQSSWNGHATNKVLDYEEMKRRLNGQASGDTSYGCCIFRRDSDDWYSDTENAEITPYISTKWYDYPQEIVVDQDIMPYLGDYCAFVNNVTTNNNDSVWTAVDKYSDIPVTGAMNNFLALVYAHRGAGYDKIRIWSDVNGDDTDSYNDYSLADGNDWIAQSELYNEDSSDNEDWVVIDLKAFTSNQLIAGKYRAQLIDSNSDKESGFVHFEMVDIEFSVTRPTSSTVHCVFGCSDNATPYRIRREDTSGLPRTYVINLSDEQKESGQYDGDFGFSDNSMFIKLYCDCEYGTVVMRIKGYSITPQS